MGIGAGVSTQAANEWLPDTECAEVVERKPNVGVRLATVGNNGPIDTKAEGEARRQQQFWPSKLTTVGHFENDHQQKWLVRGWVATSGVVLAGREFVQPI